MNLLDLIKFFGIVFMSLVFLEILYNLINGSSKIEVQPCKQHKWDYDMETGKYICIRCKGRSGEM